MNSVASAPGTARDLQQDRWLDMASRRRSAARAFWRDYLNYPRLWSRKLWRFLRTTPGKMTWLIVVLTAMTLAAGLSMSNQAAQRRIDSHQTGKKGLKSTLQLSLAKGQKLVIDLWDSYNLSLYEINRRLPSS